MKPLLVEDARARILAEAKPMPAEDVALAEAAGRVLAEDIRAARDQPPFAASAMDGWAVRGAGEAFRIIGESAAGHGYAGPLGEGEAVRIFTGAPVPDGAGRVVIQEEAARDGDQVRVPPADGGQRHIRPRGGDFEAGDLLLKAGVRLDPWRISLAAAAGRPSLRVARRPRVVVLSTGEEIVPAGASPGPDQIFDSGSPTLALLVAAWGAEPHRLRPAGDDEAAIAGAVEGAGGDVVVTLGGASVGDHDLVKPALGRLGLALVVETVKMRPGKPTWFGRLTDGRRVLGLPGNPASALVCAELFLRPFLAAMLGADPALRLRTARLKAPSPANGGREHWMRARLTVEEGTLWAAPMVDQDSSLVSVFAEADALLRRPIDAPPAEIGALVEVLPLDRA